MNNQPPFNKPQTPPFVGRAVPLQAFAREDMQEELERLQRRIEELKSLQLKDEFPAVKEEIDWSVVVAQAIEHRDFVASDDYHEDNDDQHFMFTAVFEAVFGDAYFKWENKQND